MKIGVSSYSFNRLLKAGMSYFDVCDEAKRMGYDAVEWIDLDIRYGCGQTTQQELALAIRAHCEKINLPIAAYTVGADFLNGRGCKPQEEVQRVKGCVDVACLLGAGVMRHDALWSMSGIRDWREAVDRIAPAIREVAEYAQERGIRTCTENHGLILQDSERVEQMIRKVNHPNYGWLVDIGNFLCADEDPRHAVGIAAPYAVHAHVKDFIFKNGTEEQPEGGWLTTRGGNYLRGTVVGHGIVPVKPCLHILKRAGYDGYYSVEFEGAEENIPALENSLKFLRRMDI